MTSGGYLEKSTFRVLIVDDYEPWRRFMLSNLLKWPQLQVVGEACDGREAVLKSQQLQPDLILLDIGLPKMNGIETARQIRRQSPNVRILFCTENHSPDIAEAALRTGAKGYVVKSDAARDLFPAMTAVFGGGRFVSPRFAGLEFARTSDTPSVSEKGHVVHFYTDDIVLLDGIATLFGGSLADGQSVAAIMTASHRSGLERRLLAQGVDVSEATQSGRLSILDADQVLREFMEPTGPSRERFLLKFGNMLRALQTAAVAKRSGVVVFGEMVAVLWAQQSYDAAIRIEELWNELALTCSFHLYCAYPANAFRDGVTLVPYAEICAQHSEVVSALEAIAVPHE
jgi:DNA-binding NarL/FixJ family response regulator